MPRRELSAGPRLACAERPQRPCVHGGASH